MLSADTTLRSALLAEMAESEGIRVFPADQNNKLDALADDSFTRLITAEVRRQLGKNTRFATARDGFDEFWVSFFIGNEEFWVIMPRERLEQAQAWHWLGWIALVLLLALAGGALIARQVGKPLRDLANAARLIGRGENSAPVVEAGAEETAAVARAFNQMSSDLAAIEQVRSLVLAGISHDLRTPLTRLRLAAEFINETASREGVIADVEQMDAVVGQFLDYARLGEQEAAAECDLAELAGSAAAPYASHGVQLELDELPPTQVRPLLLKRALVNLLDNAVKYGGGEIVLKLETVPWQGRPAVRFSVLDRGPGIAADSLETAKRPFVRLDTARGGIGGSGLGLAIVERTARLHSGKFRLERREGGGLSAALTLPRDS
ncbi:sensor histidine kinase [Sulfuricella denitrificans skB26]|uniref:histidine kinase n=1 Tax=Sulfuricella denitrificans (strain DSM 22764 / NBRC 105220 / skB26) TaxID=1163617 RepID=S6B505_SULDS|nr:ATP-binding protein [Sulfuricella denitrificans]BAN35647.1 sensor histidine kinase [Sulfuricella denitrificans skB26]